MDQELEDVDPEFASAFNEGEEDVGLPQAEEAAETAEEQSAEGVDGEAAEAAAAPKPAAAAAADEPAAAAAAPALTPEEIGAREQKLRSWEGRLKAREAELNAKAKPAEREGSATDEASDLLEGVAGAAAVGGSDDLAQAANAAAEAVESGELSPEQAMKQLSEDFGDEFISMIKVLAKAFAKEEVQPVAKKAEELDTQFRSREEKAHFDAISSRHPDFRDVAKSEDFKAFLAQLPEDQRADAQKVVQSGSAEEVVGLLDAFKESKRPAQADTAETDEDAAQGLEGVRSGGVRLPAKPAPAEDDFEGAWNQF